MRDEEFWVFLTKLSNVLEKTKQTNLYSVNFYMCVHVGQV